MHIDDNNRIVAESIPLTRPTGKFRVKTRRSYREYGQPFSLRRRRFTANNYVEWQISYDTVTKPGHLVISYERREQRRFLTELSFYFYKFYKWGIIRRQDAKDIVDRLQGLELGELVANHEHCRISRTPPEDLQIAGMPFSGMVMEYPQLAFRIGPYVVEIVIREKQRAVGVQPMLYFCIPISEVRVEVEAGRQLIRSNCGEERDRAIHVFRRQLRGDCSYGRNIRYFELQSP